MACCNLPAVLAVVLLNYTWPGCGEVAVSIFCLNLLCPWCVSFGYQGNSEVYEAQCQPCAAPRTGQKRAEVNKEEHCGWDWRTNVDDHMLLSHTHQLDPRSENNCWWIIIATDSRNWQFWQRAMPQFFVFIYVYSSDLTIIFSDLCQIN